MYCFVSASHSMHSILFSITEKQLNPIYIKQAENTHISVVCIHSSNSKTQSQHLFQHCHRCNYFLRTANAVSHVADNSPNNTKPWRQSVIPKVSVYFQWFDLQWRVLRSTVSIRGKRLAEWLSQESFLLNLISQSVAVVRHTALAKVKEKMLVKHVRRVHRQTYLPISV